MEPSCVIIHGPSFWDIHLVLNILLRHAPLRHESNHQLRPTSLPDWICQRRAKIWFPSTFWTPPQLGFFPTTFPPLTWYPLMPNFTLFFRQFWYYNPHITFVEQMGSRKWSSNLGFAPKNAKTDPFRLDAVTHKAGNLSQIYNLNRTSTE